MAISSDAKTIRQWAANTQERLKVTIQNSHATDRKEKNEKYLFCIFK